MVAVSRRSAQRATAARVREARQTGKYNRVAVGKSLRERQVNTWQAYGDRVLSGQEPEPQSGTPEYRQLARLGSLARYHKVDQRFLPFSKYFYHAKGQQPTEQEDEE